MKYLPLVFLLAFIAAKQATAQSLMCYVCNGEECDNIGKLEYCGVPTTTSTTGSPPSSTESTADTTESTTITPEPPASSTDSTPTLTTLAATTTQTTVTTVSTPLVSTTSGTESTLSSTESTPSSTESTASSTESIASSTESIASSTESIASSTESNPFSTESTYDTTEFTPSSTEPNTITSDLTTSSTDSTEPTTTTQPESEGNKLLKAASAAAVLIRNYRSAASRIDPVSDRYGCYSVNIEGANGSTAMQRGCINIPNGEDGCTAVGNLFPGESTSNCRVCQNDGCNGATTLQISFAVLFGIFIVKFVMQ